MSAVRRASRSNSWIPVSVLVTAVATSMSFASLHALQGADSIVPILVSLQRWTPFFWQQDRFGMLVPLLAMPVRDPLANLVVQGWVMVAAALLAPFLVARLLVDDPLEWFVAGALTNILVFLLPRPDIRFDWLVVQPYALSIALAAAGLIAAESHRRTILATALMILAHWVNSSVVALVAPLALLRRRSLSRTMAIIVCSAGVGAAMTRLSPYHTTTAILVPGEWPRGWYELLAKTRQSFPQPWAPAAIAMLGVTAAAIVWRRCRRNVRDSVGREQLAAAGRALLAGAAYWLVAGVSRWVQLNVYLPRYMYPSLLMCGSAFGIVAAAALGRVLSASIAFRTALVWCALTVVDYGTPSRERFRAALDSTGALTPDVIASGATVIGGNYWVVWPAVFHANLTSHRQNGHPVYGLTYRSAPTDDLWRNSPADIVLAAPAGDATIESWARRAGLTMTGLTRRGTIDVFVARRTRR